MGAYNEFNAFGEGMDNPVAPWFVNGDDENGGHGNVFESAMNRNRATFKAKARLE